MGLDRPNGSTVLSESGLSKHGLENNGSIKLEVPKAQSARSLQEAQKCMFLGVSVKMAVKRPMVKMLGPR